LAGFREKNYKIKAKESQWHRLGEFGRIWKDRLSIDAPNPSSGPGRKVHLKKAEPFLILPLVLN
jgi:hypothetical protein